MGDLFDDLLAPEDDTESGARPSNILVVGEPAANSAELTKLARWIEAHPIKIIFIEADGSECTVR
jgi:hypothetical protein